MDAAIGGLRPVQAVADELKVSPATIRLWIHKGYIPNIRIGSRLYILWDQFVQQNGSEECVLK